GPALAAHPKGGPCLRPFGDGERLLLVQRRDADLATERQGREVQRHFAVQVVPLALEERMVLHLHHDVEIAAGPAGESRFAFAGDAQPLSGRDTGRDAHRQLALLLDTSRAAAGGARLGDDLAAAPALSARARDGEEALLIPQLPASMALRAGRGGAAFRRAAAAARLTR